MDCRIWKLKKQQKRTGARGRPKTPIHHEVGIPEYPSEKEQELIGAIVMTASKLPAQQQEILLAYGAGMAAGAKTAEPKKTA